MKKKLLYLLLIVSSQLFSMETTNEQSRQKAIEISNYNQTWQNSEEFFSASEDEFFDAYQDENALETDKHDVFKEDLMSKLPNELIQQIALLTARYETMEPIVLAISAFDTNDDIAHLIKDFLNLRRINKNWKNIVDQQQFWKIIFSDFFRYVVKNFSFFVLKNKIRIVQKIIKLTEQKVEKNKIGETVKLLKFSKNLKITHESLNVLINIYSNLNTILQDEKFWELVFTDYFNNILPVKCSQLDQETKQGQELIKAIGYFFKEHHYELVFHDPYDPSSLLHNKALLKILEIAQKEFNKKFQQFIPTVFSIYS